MDHLETNSTCVIDAAVLMEEQWCECLIRSHIVFLLFVPIAVQIEVTCSVMEENMCMSAWGHTAAEFSFRFMLWIDKRPQTNT